MQRDKETLYDDGNIVIELEVLQGVPFLHSHVEKYNKTVYKTLKEIEKELYNAFRFYEWEEVFVYTTNSKFIRLFPGFEKINEVEYEGETYEVMKWDLTR